LLKNYWKPWAATAVLLLTAAAFFLSGDGSVITTAEDGAVAVSGDLNVGGDLTVNPAMDPRLMALVQDTVAKLTGQLGIKDDQIRTRDDLNRQLTAAVAALVQRRESQVPSNDIDNAMADLAKGDAGPAKRVFREILDRKAAEAREAAMVAAQAAQHLGALAGLDSEQEALIAYQRALELDPDNTVARQQVAAIQKEPGQLRLQAALVPGGEPVHTCFIVYHAGQDIDGNRKEVRRDCTTTVRWTLDAGRYFVRAQAGEATASEEITIEPGAFINRQWLLRQPES